MAQHFQETITIRVDDASLDKLKDLDAMTGRALENEVDQALHEARLSLLSQVQEWVRRYG